ncbi:hypothetical protein QQ73_15160, partial [Candidatus Endoriftia persephone str. Guaymas]|nr:hypothetical protein [Candidatus Endoriftia persephone str. Guaymas]
GTPERVALGMGEEDVSALREVGKLLAFLKEPDPPKGMKDAWQKLPVFKKVLDMAPKELRNAPCQAISTELAALFELPDKIAQILVLHGGATELVETGRPYPARQNGSTLPPKPILWRRQIGKVGFMGHKKNLKNLFWKLVLAKSNIS